MKKILTFLMSVLILVSCQSQKQNPKNVITTDIANFWQAYDKIISTQDSNLQYHYLDSLYLQRGTDGLAAMIQVRNYTPEDFINAINNYPKFWESVRDNTFEADEIGSKFGEGIEKLRKVYPDLRPAKIYFTIGALRSGGTTLDSLVLIGSEIAMADSTVETSELPESMSHLGSYFKTNPKNDMLFLNIHEYIHTQQKPLVYNLLSIAIFEGVAEFITTKALGIESPNQSIEFGKRNADRIKEVFELEMFYPNNQDKWFWGNAPNEFGVRDLGYFVGYQMSEGYYEQAEDKQEAIKQMIELDYNNESEIEEYVKKTNYFSKSLDELYEIFESKRPTVIGIKQFENNSQNVSPSIKEITIAFSKPLNGHNTGVELGELGREAFPKGDPTKKYWSEDNASWTIAVDLEPNKHYQILFSNNFRTEDGIPLKPYFVEFKTGAE